MSKSKWHTATTVKDGWYGCLFHSGFHSYPHGWIIGEVVTRNGETLFWAGGGTHTLKDLKKRKEKLYGPLTPPGKA